MTYPCQASQSKASILLSMVESVGHTMATTESVTAGSTEETERADSDGIEDGVYHQLKAVFLASGKGRRPNLPSQLQLTNRLLVQVLRLRDEGKKTFDEAAEFLCKLLPESDLTFASSRYKLVSMKAKQELGSVSSLQQSKPVSVNSLGPYLDGVTRQSVLDGQHVKTYRPPSYGLLKDLLTLKRKESKSNKDVCQWWLQLTGNSASEACMTKAAARFQKKHATLQPSAHRPAGRTKFTSFLDSSPFPSSPSCSQSASTSSAPPNGKGDSLPDYAMKLAEGAKQLFAAGRREHELQKDIEDLKFRVSVLIEINKDSQMELAVLRKEKEELQQRCATLKRKADDFETKINDRNARVAEITRQLNYVRDKGVEKKLQRKEAKVVELKEKLEENEVNVRTAEDDQQRLREELRKQQVKQADMRRQLDKAKRKIAAERQPDPLPLPVPQQPAAPEEVRLKNEMGHFKNSAKIVIMSLVGECEVPAHRCGQVIKTVIENVCDARVPEGDLPSQRSALRFADHMHVISKAHVADTLLKTDHWDLHVDGTTRGGMKYVCQQVTTNEGTLSLGFIPVATEDTTTLVDVTLQMLEEISDIYSGTEAQQIFVQMLVSLTSIMSDRASVMKSFGRSLQEERKLLIQTDEGLEFLHCNAHYLLGLGAECKKVLSREEKESGEKLGRDALPRFSSYNKATECSAFRYVRTACDILGPRGDDKNGIRDYWEGYCLSVGRRSAVTSFRENRFNNLFQAAAGLYYHRHDVQDCLDVLSQVKTLNGKVASVAADNASEVINNHVITLGLVYFRITGPYWSLLGASVHYLDFFNYVGRLHRLLMAWSLDASSALDADCEPLFPDINFRHDGNILQSLLSIGEEKRAAVTAVLQKVCAGLVEVTERQLADFLPQGKYYNVDDPELRAKLQHSHITNLVSEENFADLDFSLFKRRSSSLHHHSTINMLKRNKSISSWLLHKPLDEQKHLLDLSSQKAKSLREKHVLMERDAVREKRDLLQRAREKKEAADEKKRQKVLGVMDDLKPHQGPCSVPADIHRLLELYTTDGGLKKALRAEILFQKMVMNQTSPHLKVTGSSLTLVNRLLQFFGGLPVERLPALPDPQGPPAKRPRRELFEVESSSEEDEEVEEMEVEPVFERRFQFERLGEIVAVYYEDAYYIGEVCELNGIGEAGVNFMERMKGSAIFRWPVKEDRCPIPSDVVFAGNIALAPSSSSGRSFIVENPSDLPAKYDAFKAYLIENVL